LVLLLFTYTWGNILKKGNEPHGSDLMISNQPEKAGGGFEWESWLNALHYYFA
jgi:hypothetical protein